jgi:hypothetical protein
LGVGGQARALELLPRFAHLGFVGKRPDLDDEALAAGRRCGSGGRSRGYLGGGRRCCSSKRPPFEQCPRALGLARARGGGRCRRYHGSICLDGRGLRLGFDESGRSGVLVRRRGRGCLFGDGGCRLHGGFGNPCGGSRGRFAARYRAGRGLLRHHQRRELVAVGNFNAGIDGDGARLGVEDQGEADHAHENQKGRTHQPVPRAPAHDFHGFAAHRPCHFGGLGFRRLLPGPANLEKCHGKVEN